MVTSRYYGSGEVSNEESASLDSSLQKSRIQVESLGKEQVINPY